MAPTLNVPVISLRDFDNRRPEIIKELLEASETIGFFSLVDHGITVEEIESQFAISRAYFALPHDVKGEIPHQLETNDGWEYKKQVRVESPNTVDQKESFWLKRNSQWPTDEQVPGFKETTNNFITKCAGISAQVLTCLSIALGFEEDFFNKAMNVNADDNQTQLRMIHYMPSENAVGTWRAGAHTDIGCLTLLFQRDGEDGLEVLPGREAHNSGIGAGNFSPIPAKTGPIVVNIGDMMMAWSDDRFKANYHRVRAKDVGKSPARYSIAYFNTGRKDVVLQGPLKKYPALTCGEYFLGKTKLHFGKQDALEKEKRQQSMPKAPMTATVTPLPSAITA